MAIRQFQAVQEAAQRPVMGLLLLSTDETLEDEMRAMFPPDGNGGAPLIHSARVESAPDVSVSSLAAMRSTISAGAAMLPAAPDYSVIGYGCTSATAVLGSAQVAELVRKGRAARAVTTPLGALVAYCKAHAITRLAVLTPYLPSVTEKLTEALALSGIEAPDIGAFSEPSEAAVARIAFQSTRAAGLALLQGSDAQALFISCTNLRTHGLCQALERETGKTVLSSNSALAWHMARLAGISPEPRDITV